MFLIIARYSPSYINLRDTVLKSIIISLLLAFLSFKSFSQHKYENPREKSKRGLLEEPFEEKAVVENESSSNSSSVSKRMSKKEVKFCSCEKIYFLSLKRLQLHNKLVENDIVKTDSSVWKSHDRHKHKASKTMKMIRAKYEMDEEYV